MNITWWGHATSTVELAGVRFLTDPVFTARVLHLERAVGAVPAAAAREADAVLVSHLHADHLHLPSLKRLPARTRLIAPRGTAAVLARRLPQLRVEEVEPGDVVAVDGVRVEATAAWHDGHRLPLSPHHGPALGFVLRSAGQSVWFAGDTGLFDDMDAIGPVDVALVPVGGWGPTLGPHHLDPEQAAEAVRRVGARDAVPVHYGTFWPTGLRQVAPAMFRHKCLEPGRRFAAAMRVAGARAHVIGHGESVALDGPA